MKEMEERLRKNTFTLTDFLVQFEQIQKMGDINQLAQMIPGVSQKLNGQTLDSSKLVKYKAIIQSMTIEERENPDIIKGDRKRRIADGSATSIQDVNSLLKQFEQTKQLMKNVNSGKMGKLMGLANKFSGRF